MGSLLAKPGHSLTELCRGFRFILLIVDLVHKNTLTQRFTYGIAFGVIEGCKNQSVSQLDS